MKTVLPGLSVVQEQETGDLKQLLHNAKETELYKFLGTEDDEPSIGSISWRS